MPHTHRTFSLACLALTAAALAPTARADIRYTTQMQFGGMTDAKADAMPAGMTMPGLRTTTYVKDMHERVETSMSMGPIHTDQVTLTLCDKHQTVKLDSALKIYTVSPIGVAAFGPPPGSKGMRGMSQGEAMPNGKPGVGHVTMTFSIQDLGTEKVTDLDARHYKIGLRTQTTGCIGTGDQTMQLEEWIAPVKAGLNCPERYSPTRTVPNENGCQITYDMKGDWDKMRDLHGGMVVRQKIYTGDKVIATSDLRDYSSAALDDSLFAAPTDYKQVSQADFDKAERDAMMKNMMRGMGQAAAPPDTDDAPDAAKAAAGDAADAAKAAAADAASSATDAANAAANAPANAADSAAAAASDAASAAASAAADAAKKKIKLPHFPF